MKKILHTMSVLAVTYAAVGCVEEYEPTLTADHESILVVDGIITDGETTIRLSRSQGLQEGVSFPFGDEFSPLWVTGATVWVESESGGRLDDTREETAGRYLIATGQLDENESYRVVIHVGGEQYASEFRKFQAATSLDAIKLHHPGGTEPLQVRLDATGGAGHSSYYRWTYDETWEIRTFFRADIYLGRFVGDWMTPFTFGELRYTDLNYYSFGPGGSPFRIGWKRGKNQALLLGETGRLSQNVVRDHTLYEIGVSSDRLSVLYHTTVSQYSLGQDAYFYLDNLKRNTDEAGSIFAPIPSEMRGNVVCVTNPDIPVIGFVEASQRAQKEIYLSSADSPYVAPRITCTSYDSEESYDDIDLNALYPYSGSFEDGMLLTELRCIDCRELGASPNRPSWWPVN